MQNINEGLVFKTKESANQCKSVTTTLASDLANYSNYLYRSNHFYPHECRTECSTMEYEDFSVSKLCIQKNNNKDQVLLGEFKSRAPCKGIYCSSL